MPDISLRAYGREIDELIERERLDEAIAHCRYILQTYPKHLETYRHLGKAYLEAKRYGDAADIFQRVLSAVPDDFVSHVGMAIVREDEGNLDASIWHMERAFETNPSNPAIQQEMKRLISRRDGLEPHKVRLTRGALARMYAHGELYAQAIAELRSALQEDAERPDLQVLLASMYWKTDQRSDATSVSNQILEKLPYCSEANRIQAANLQANDRVEEAAVYHRRLANLDPYAAFVESALADAKSVEDSAVSLEKLAWVAGEPLPSATTGQPGWATTLGMEMQEPRDKAPESAAPTQTGPLPSWLEPGEPPPFEASAEKELREEMQAQGEDSSGELPEASFLHDLEPESHDEDQGSGFDEDQDDTDRRRLGFEAAAAGITAGILTSDDDEEETEEQQAAEFDAGAAAAAGTAAGTLADAGEEEEGSGSAISFGAEPVGAAGMFDQAEDVDGSDSNLIEDESAPVGEESKQGGVSGDQIPEWMQEAGWGESKGEFQDAPVSFSDQELHSLDAGEIPSQGDDDDVELAPAELPDWIHDIAPDEVEDAAGGVGVDSLPSWIGAESAAEDEPVIVPAPPAAETEDGSDDREASFPASESDTGEIPTWITDDPPGATETIVTWLEDRGPDSLEDEASANEDLPDWMRDTGPLEESLDAGQIDEEVLSAEAEMVSSELPSSEMPEDQSDIAPAADEWLSAVAAVAAEEESPASPEDKADETPDWLSEAMDSPADDESGGGLGIAAAGLMAGKGGGEQDSVEATSDQEQDAISFTSAEPDVPDRDQDHEIDTFESAAIAASIDELEIPESKLADEHHDAGEELTVPTEDQPETSKTSSAPDWLQEIGTLPDQPVQTDSADWLEGLEIDGADSPVESAAETPDWLKGLAEEGIDGDESAAAPAADWLREIGQPGSVAEEQAAAVESAPQDEQADQLEPETAGEAPDWLQGFGSSADEETPSDVEAIEDYASQTPATPAEEDDEVMDWLQDLAAKQAEAPAEEELAGVAQVEAGPPILEERDIPDQPEEGLEWLEQLADQRGMDVDVTVPGQTTPPSSSPEPEPEPEPESAPGWLGRMATQPIPKVDMEALEAAARGQGISPEAETIKAKAGEVEEQPDEASHQPEEEQLDEASLQPEKEQLDEASLQPERAFEQQQDSDDAAPDDIRIEAQASDLEEAIEPQEELAVSSDADEEIPDWLIAAAEQSEPKSEVPEGLPTEFAEQVVEPAAVEEEDFPIEELEPEIVEPVIPEADLSEELPAVDEIQPRFDASAPEPVEPIDKEGIEPSAVEETEAFDAAMEEPAASPPAIKKKEDLLERPRRALASGDTQSASELYGDLVKRKDSLDSVIEDLRIALERTPDNAVLWQVLGDAYMRDDQTDEAIEAYRRGMEAA